MNGLTDKDKQVTEDFLRDNILVNNMRIMEKPVPEALIDNDYRRLRQDIKGRERRKYIIRSISSAAACIIILLSVVFGIDYYNRDESQHAYALLDSVDVKADKIQIIAGVSQVNIKDSATIKQTKDGDVVVDEKKVSDSFITQTEYLQLVVPYGKRTSISFSDGTVVWVNSGTSVVYPQQFQKNKREIFVDGEIYLEVAEDKARPFIVRTKKFDISVLGTKFNINSFDKESEASVVLVEGSVEVSTKLSKNKLAPNQGLFLKDNIAEIKEVDVYPFICWKDGFMKLNGESLEVIFNRLAKYYRVDFKLDKAIAGERYIGKLDLSESIDHILYNLSLTTSFTYKKQNDTINIVAN